jgi:predicted RNase H-like nuclease (RuvC/YqgF family)
MTQFTDKDKIQLLQQTVDKLEDKIKFLKNELCLCKEAIGDYENKLKDMELEDMIDDNERLHRNSKNNQTHTGGVTFVASTSTNDVEIL